MELTTALRSHVTKLGGAPADVTAVRDALQEAIRLEHAVIPSYLYALYSLGENENKEISDVLASIVAEEMLHMVLAANVLNAVGGHPVLTGADFVPSYPCRLPYGLDEDVEVNLEPFTVRQKEQPRVPLRATDEDVTFVERMLNVEQPKHPLTFTPQPADATRPTDAPFTVGDFYEKIVDAITELGNDAFTGNRRAQIGPHEVRHAVVVDGVETAVLAIRTITDQGEGSKRSPAEVVGHALAHYYRLMEIQQGRHLVPVSPTVHGYAGPEINFDRLKVLGVPKNPRASGYHGRDHHACTTFNQSYGNLLATLELTLNGAPGRFGSSLGLMMSLKRQALDMMTGSSIGAAVGPTFEWAPQCRPRPESSI